MRIAIDCTSVREETAANTDFCLISQTIRALCAVPGYELILMTAAWNHEMFISLEGENVKCVCITDDENRTHFTMQAVALCEAPKCQAILKKLIPSRISSFLKAHQAGISRNLARCAHPIQRLLKPACKRLAKLVLSQKLQTKLHTRRGLVRAAQSGSVRLPAAPLQKQCLDVPAFDLFQSFGQPVDILFFPFPSVAFYDPKVTVISVAGDIMHRYYPQFFSAEELRHRESFCLRLSAMQSYIVASSNATLRAYLQHYPLPKDHIRTICPPLSDRFSIFTQAQKDEAFARMGLGKRPFIFFPANFLACKNHKLLFIAFRMYLEQNPQSDLRLALAGNALGNAEHYARILERMELSERVSMLGYVDDVEMAALYENCYYMIYPSLFEDFGVPVAEAMGMGATVVCSNSTALPEVAGDCAVYFDPRTPDSILNAMIYVDEHPQEIEQKKRLYARQLEKFDFHRYVQQYIDLFEETSL